MKNFFRNLNEDDKEVMVKIMEHTYHQAYTDGFNHGAELMVGTDSVKRVHSLCPECKEKMIGTGKHIAGFIEKFEKEDEWVECDIEVALGKFFGGGKVQVQEFRNGKWKKFHPGDYTMHNLTVRNCRYLG